MWICPECRQIYEKAVERCERDDAPVAEVFAHQTKSRYPLLGRIVGDRYHLIGGLGQGGLGTVYLAQHRHLGQLFAVKFLDLATIGATTDMDDAQKAGFRRDFLREAQVATVVRHPAVVRVNDFGEHDGLPFLVMEFVPGPSLLHMLGTRGKFPIPEAVAIARRIAEALDAFHERRLVHRDVKPANVILDPRGDGRLTLVDLGLVKDLSSAGARNSTHPLALRGTPGYLAPEQVPPWVLAQHGVTGGSEKRVVDARVDLYALGVIFYEMLAGVSPYPDGTNTQIILYACTRDPIPLGQAAPGTRLPAGLEDFVYSTMHRDPDRRPQNAAAFLERLDEVVYGQAMQGSWPAIILPNAGPRPDARPREPSSATELPPAPAVETDDPGKTAALDALTGFDEGGPDADLDESQDSTAVYSDADERKPNTDASAPRTLEERTLDADAPMQPGDDADFDAEMHTAVERVAPRSSAPRSAGQTLSPPPARLAGHSTSPGPPRTEGPARAAGRERRSRVPRIVVGLCLAALAASVGWFFAERADERDSSPTIVRVGTDDPRPASIVAGDVVPTAAPTVAPTVAPTAAPTVAPTAAPTAAPTVATTGPVRRRPAPPSKGLENLLAEGNAAYKARDHARALALYSDFLKRAGEQHDDYWMIHSRVQGLEAILSRRE